MQDSFRASSEGTPYNTAESLAGRCSRDSPAVTNFYIVASGRCADIFGNLLFFFFSHPDGPLIDLLISSNCQLTVSLCS